MGAVLLLEPPPVPIPASAPPNANTLQPVRCAKCARTVALAYLTPGSVLELKCRRCGATTLVVGR